MTSAIFIAFVLIFLGSGCQNNSNVVETETIINKSSNTNITKVIDTKEKNINVVEVADKSLSISTSAWKEGGSMPKQYTCDGEGINPPLIFSNIDSGTVAFALIMEDVDVPDSIRPDGVWNHWLIWNIPATETIIDAGSVPEGVYGQTTSGVSEYVPPCPPDSQHRYVFNLYALDRILNIKQGASREELEKAMKGKIIQQADLVGLYNRQ